jgi:outer membrane protein OmpA-like peptidoglycan-associated protein
MTSIGFALPAFYGTKGTNFVSSARCEDMGFLWFNIAPEGYLDHVIFQDSGGTIDAEYHNQALKPMISLGFTPWHYLEFSAFGSAYFYRNSETSASVFGLGDVGAHIKGSIPFTPLDAPLVTALGIDGFFNMTLPFEMDAAGDALMSQYLGYYPFDQAGPEFGGKLLFSMESKYISGHVNAGYWYRSAHTIDAATVQFPQTIVSGIGIESNPFPWLNPFLDFNLNYGLPMLTPDTLTGISTHMSLGVRFPIMMGKNKGFGLLFTLAGGADPMNFGSTFSLYAGVGIGGDLIKPKEKFLEGTVVDAESGKPIKDAQIVISGPDRDSALTMTTDSLGHFVISEKQLMKTDSLYVTAENYHPEARVPDELQVILSSKEKVPLEMELEKIKESWLAGIVSDAATSEPLKAVIRFEDIDSGTVMNPIVSDPITGYFRLNIKPGAYKMQTSSKGYVDDNRTISIKVAQDTIIDVLLTQIEKPVPVVLEDIVITGFGKAQTDLSLMQLPYLEKIIEIMQAHPDATIVIKGHTDSIGSDVTNIRVGERRARGVYDFLLAKGISATRMRIESYGERYPVGDNRYNRGREANRRVEVSFSTGGSDDGGDHGVTPPTSR